jgi:radical SAM enzyme (rSAM/lipoprotein system)
MKTDLSLRERLVFDLARVHRKAKAALHDLTYLFWECTLRCNLECRHCGSDCRTGAATSDMPLEDFLRVVDRVGQAYPPAKTTVVMTGGEPLLRSDLDRCGAELARRGFPWGFVTNGYALSGDRFARLRESGLRSLSISVDGLQDSHAWLRGRTDSFPRAIQAVELAAKSTGLNFDVITCVNRQNFPELAEVRRLLIDKGVKRWRVGTIFPKGRAADDPLLDISNEQFRELMEFIKATREEGAILASYGCEGFLGPYERKARTGVFFCWAGINVGSVLADGSISACPSLRGDYIQGNIYRDDFIDCWNNRFKVMRDRSWTRTGPCATCKAYRWCEGNGLHLRDEKTGRLLRCHLKMLEG